MKKLLLLQLIILLFIALACNKDDEDQEGISLEKVSGFVQKGPYLNGTSVTIYEMTDKLLPTGKNFPSQISDNAGTFEVKNVDLISQYVLLKADGFYFDEVANTRSAAQLTLYALSDMTNKTSLNVNILSTLEKGRTEYLISTGISFTEAKKQAQAEILDIFEMSKTEMTKSEELDISKPGDDNGILLAISSILQGYLSVAELSELIANIGTDIREDGILNDQALGEKLNFNAHKLYPDQIRKNLEDRYKSLNMVVTIPDFEKYIDQFIENTGFKFNALPELTTNNEVKNIKANSAICGGNVSKEGISSVTAKGICWSTDQNPDIEDYKIDVGPGCDTFTCNITGLMANTTYYIRAYATNNTGTAYGNEVSVKTKESGIGTVTDIDGNLYHTVIIGNQVWMVENLRTTKYRNGGLITKITDKPAWQSTNTGAYCWYNNDIKNKSTYGALYNWYAVDDVRKIAPEGWHVPSLQEWNTLLDYLGGSKVAGGKLKETGTLHWTTPNTGATNETGFCAVPGGLRNDPGDFYALGNFGYWWCADEGENSSSAWSQSMGFILNEVENYGYCSKISGYSVRCIKD
jgi:uncharacterized protein (TIGR02145 family)